MLVGGDTLGGGGLFGAVHFRVLNTALQMNYQHNFTCRLLRDWGLWSNWRKKHLFLAHGLKAQPIMCVKWRRQDDENDALVAPWGTWWSHCMLRHEAERGVQLAFSFWTFKKVFEIFIYLFIHCALEWVCTHAFRHHCMYVEVRGWQHAGAGSLLPPCGSSELNSGSQA